MGLCGMRQRGGTPMQISLPKRVGASFRCDASINAKKDGWRGDRVRHRGGGNMDGRCEQYARGREEVRRAIKFEKAYTIILFP